MIRRDYFQLFTKLCEYVIKMEPQKNSNLLSTSENKFSKFGKKIVCYS